MDGETLVAGGNVESLFTSWSDVETLVGLDFVLLLELLRGFRGVMAAFRWGVVGLLGFVLLFVLVLVVADDFVFAIVRGVVEEAVVVVFVVFLAPLRVVARTRFKSLSGMEDKDEATDDDDEVDDLGGISFFGSSSIESKNGSRE
jgi:hypothetical protein